MREWFQFLDDLKNEMNESVLKQWVYSLKIIKFDACNLYLEAKNKFQINWYEEHLKDHVEKKLKNCNHRPINVHLSLKEERVEPFKINHALKKEAAVVIEPDSLSKEFDFNNFFVEEKNRLTFQFLFELTQLDSKIPFASYNPIFLHGPSSSGKTHLLVSLAKELIKKEKKVFYVKAQTFTQHVVDAIRQSSLYIFREKYRNVDLLILDDIHLLAKKTATQEEFFHTFNTLHTAGKQLILSSSIPTQQMKEIEPRLISRFEWGISLYLDQPQQMTLKFILEQSLKKFDISLNQDIINFIVSTFPNVKDLQKALQVLILRTQQDPKKDYSISQIEFLVGDLILDLKKEQITTEKIIETVAKHFGITTEDILGKSQTKECSHPRQIAMFFCREILKMPFKKIGELFSRDHSTVMTNIKTIQTAKNCKSKESYYNLLEIEKIIKR